MNHRQFAKKIEAVMNSQLRTFGHIISILLTKVIERITLAGRKYFGSHFTMMMLRQSKQQNRFDHRVF